MCSMNTGQCPSHTYAGYQFNNHYDLEMADLVDETNNPLGTMVILKIPICF